MKLLGLVGLVFVFLQGGSAQAGLPEVAQTSEKTIKEDYEKKVMPLWKTAKQGTLVGRDKMVLVYHTLEVEKEKGAIVFVLGWTETAQKYAEFYYNLNKAGYSVYILDNRGQGLSQRLVVNPQMVHVESYGDYVSDLKQFVDRVVKKTAHNKLFMWCHSMGGLIGGLYASQYEWDLDGLILSSPLLQVHTGNVPESVAYNLAKLGSPKSYILGHGDSSKLDASDFKKQTATHSEPRWGKKVALWYSVPQSFMSGSSNRWLQRTLEAGWWLRDTGAAQISIPVLVFKAEKDARVWNPGVDAVCKAIRKCTSHLIKDGYHELLLETDSIRNFVIDKSITFIERN